MFKIGNHTLGPDFPPFIIAELSANHNGSLVKAKEAVKRAKNAGAHAVKIQTYTPETMTLDSRKEDFLIQDGLWAGYSLYELYDEAHTPYAWHEDLFVFASQLNMTLFSSVFDETSVDLLEKLGTPAYKIASFELTDIPLIDYVAKTKKPVLLSTGMSSLEEIGEAVETVKSNGNNSILLFHCVSSYPTSVVESNIRNIEFLQKEFGLPVGLSDHTICQTAAIAATALGAVAIEKHFKVRKNDTGPDSSFSISPSELRSLVKKTNVRFRRSLYFVKDKKCGDTVKLSDVRRIRPGFGLNPKHLDDIIDRKLTKDVERGDPVTWDVIE
jgi:pseudaminic acid synthase